MANASSKCYMHRIRIKLGNYKLNENVTSSIITSNQGCQCWNKWLHRFWWRMLETICVGDNFKMLVTVLAILVTNIHYLFILRPGTNIHKMSPTSQNRHQLLVTNISFTEINFWESTWNISIGDKLETTMYVLVAGLKCWWQIWEIYVTNSKLSP